MTWRRRLRLFNANPRARRAARLLLALTFFSLTAEVWSNDRPILLYAGHHLYAPVFSDYAPERLGQPDTMLVDYRALALKPGDWALWPPNRWGPYRTNKHVAEYPAPPSRDNWFGTDDRGRDVFARLLYGFRYGITFALATWLICSLFALIYGGACGYFGRWVDLIGQRALEITSTVPQLLLLIYLLSVFEPSLTILVLVSCAFGWIGMSYLVRGEVLRTRALEYVEASRALGAGSARLVWSSILPNCLVPLVTLAPFMIVANLTGLAGLDFLGLGLPPPTPSWGELMAQAQIYFKWAWWLALFPSATLFVTLLWLTFVGEGVRGAFDPAAAAADLAPSPARRPGRVRRLVLANAARALAFTFVLLTGAPAWARAASVNVETFHYQATDPMDMSTTRLGFAGSSTGGPVRGYGGGTELNEGVSRDVRFRGLKGSGFTRLEFTSDTSLTLTGGANRLSSLYPHAEAQAMARAAEGGGPSEVLVGRDETIPVYALSVHTGGAGQWNLQVDLSHDYVYREWTQPRAAGSMIVGTKYAVSGDALIGRRLRPRANGSFVTLNDGNVQRVADLALMVDVINRRDWILVGAGVWYDDLERRGRAYWTPREMIAPSLRSESHLRWSRDVSLNLTANAAYGGEHLRPHDLSYVLDAKLDYQLRSTWHLGLGCVRMEAFNARGASTWYRNDLYASLSAQL